VEINLEILKLARESRGLSQKELSVLLGIEQGTLSKVENEFLSMDNELIDKIAIALDYPRDFFFQKWDVHLVSGHYRKKISLPQKEVKKQQSRMTIVEWQLEKLLNSVELPTSNLPNWDCEYDGSPDMCANYVREYWKMPKGRIDNITQLVEANGVLVIAMDLGEFDGFSMFSNSGVPVIFVNKNVPGDRFRFIVAHELSHLILHFAKKIDENRLTEDEAHLFASEFLIPSREIKPHLTKLTIEKLATLKSYWKVSMQAILVKSFKQLSVISQDQYYYLWKQMSYLGYRKKEPILIARETPSLMNDIIGLHLNELGYTKSELSTLLHTTDREFNNVYTDNLRALNQKTA
jgi:Zn-dependent peptidase ImmA (M78 family)/DNA-binding XRE family transcriptional regulator